MKNIASSAAIAAEFGAAGRVQNGRCHTNDVVRLTSTVTCRGSTICQITRDRKSMASSTPTVA
ncbi:hypothetical protein EYF80_065337 [Liparis tanakae]|uniref:Uncharacterized protein n=1 Tax=Liparis tanakae TaxID=230148 RepID=A0A4Z2E6Z5_9TELE|nr:hypothetical protein EYF80_065337 [Liparis tanakae]